MLRNFAEYRQLAKHKRPDAFDIGHFQDCTKRHEIGETHYVLVRLRLVLDCKDKTFTDVHFHFPDLFGCKHFEVN